MTCIEQITERWPAFGRAFFFAALALIGVWQLWFYYHPETLDPATRLTASSGRTYEKYFVPFYYFTGLYPVTATSLIAPEDYPSPRVDVRVLLEKTGYRPINGTKEALDILKREPETLLNEYQYTIRVGDRGKIFPYMFSALVNRISRGTLDPLSVTPAMAALYILSLLAVFTALWKAGATLLAAAVILFVGSDPFQLYEVYAADNIFGLNISAALMMMALSVSYIFGGKSVDRLAMVRPAVAGVALGLMKQVRPEPAAIVISLIFVYLTCEGFSSWKRRIIAITLMLVAYTGAMKLCDLYFDYKIGQSYRVILAHGGEPFDFKTKMSYHVLWHPLWCGLGDFGGDKGYQWRDDSPWLFAAKKMNERGITLESRQTSKYVWYKYIEPEYVDILKEKVLGDIISDPVWYFHILGSRAWKILMETTPVSVAAWSWRAVVPFNGLFAALVVIVLLARRDWTRLKLALFTLPTSATALLIYSGGGTTGYTIFHLVCAAILLESVTAMVWRGFMKKPRGI